MKNLDDAYVAGRSEVILKSGGRDVVFYVHELGFLTQQNIALHSDKHDRNTFSALVAESVTDAEGNKFTYDEVCRLKREYAEPLFAAVVKMLGAGEEKN